MSDDLSGDMLVPSWPNLVVYAIFLCGKFELCTFNYLPPGSPAGDYNLHHVCTSMHPCVRECMRAWVTQFSLKLLQLHIFGKLLVLMNFYTLQNFLGLVNFGLLLSE